MIRGWRSATVTVLRAISSPLYSVINIYSICIETRKKYYLRMNQRRKNTITVLYSVGIFIFMYLYYGAGVCTAIQSQMAVCLFYK